jgi:DNA-binding PadR family transcriptional regulator
VRENRSQYAILGALTLGPMSGYDLKQFADESVRHFWAESFGQIYPILRRLEADGLVARQPAPPAPAASGPPTGRERIVYGITDAGRAALARWVGEPPHHEVGRVEVLLKLFFARNGPPGTAEHLLRAFRAEHAARLERYAAVERRLRAERGTFADLPYWLATLSYGRHVSRALVAWCDESLAALGDGPTPGA